MATVNTEGPIRGMLGRWVMRFEAAGQIISMVFQGVTAVSALSGVLAYTGYQSLVPYVLASGSAGVFVFAYIYVELGVYNRKNREKQDRGNNFAKPGHRINNEMIARSVTVGLKNRRLRDDEVEEIKDELDETYRELRSGVEA